MTMIDEQRPFHGSLQQQVKEAGDDPHRDLSCMRYLLRRPPVEPIGYLEDFASAICKSCEACKKKDYVPPAPHPGAVAKTALPKAIASSDLNGGYFSLIPVKNSSNIFTGTNDMTAPPQPPPNDERAFGSSYVVTYQSGGSPRLHTPGRALAACLHFPRCSHSHP
jgi:hypothetical protein